MIEASRNQAVAIWSRRLGSAAMLGAALTLGGCAAGGGSASSQGSATVQAFDQAAYQALVAESGRHFSSQSACVTYLDSKFDAMALDGSGAPRAGLIVYPASDGNGHHQRRMRRPGRHSTCGVQPPPGSNISCTADGALADIFTCHQGTLSHRIEPPVP